MDHFCYSWDKIYAWLSNSSITFIQGSFGFPMFHITQPLDSMIGIYGLLIMATILGDVQYTQVMGHLTTPEIPVLSTLKRLHLWSVSSQ